MSKGQITFCDEPSEPSKGSITFCNKQEESDGSLTFCEKCENLDPLIITGTDAPSSGSAYAASGGRGPYKFSSSCGNIGEETGVFGADINSCCGSGSVTVSDDCGNSATITVRFAGGRWVETSRTPGCGTNANNTCTVITGDSKRIYQFRYDPVVDGVDFCSCPCADPQTLYIAPHTYKANTQYTINYRWECP